MDGKAPAADRRSGDHYQGETEVGSSRERMSGPVAAAETDNPQTRRATYTVVARAVGSDFTARKSRSLFALAGFSLATAGAAWLGFHYRPAENSRVPGTAGWTSLDSPL